MTTPLPARVTRILTMIPYLDRHPGIRVREAAEYLGCDAATLMADLDAALLCGVPPYLPNDYIGVVLERERIYLSFASHFRRPVNLTVEEALALGLALEELPLTEGGLAAAARLREKVAGLLPKGLRGEWRAARGRLAAGRLHEEVRRRMAVIEEGVEAGRELWMEYFSAGRDEMTERVVRPLGVVEHGGEWYLIAFCLLRDRELPFRVDRIRRLRLLEGRFTPPAGFSIERYDRAQMYFPTRGDVRVKLRVSAGETVRGWEGLPMVSTRATREGGMLLYLPVNSRQWIVSWVLERAGTVELLAPEALRQEVATACGRALGRYG